MKRIIVLVVAAMMATMSVNAQGYSYYDTKHEVGISIGYPSTSQVFSAIADFTALVLEATMTSVVTLGTVTGYEYGDKVFTPSFSGEYYYHISKVVGIGGMLTYNNMHRDIIFKWQNNTDKTTHQDKYGTATHHNISIIPTFKFDWLRTKNFGMYSKAGVGATIMLERQKVDGASSDVNSKNNSTSVIPNFHLSLLGLEAGSTTVRGFVELGVGEQGFGVAGLRYKF